MNGWHRHSILIVAVSLSIFFLNPNQTLAAPETETVPAFVLPQPEGGIEALVRNVVYPEAAIKDGVAGKVTVEIEIGTDGKVKQATVKNSLREDLDKAALKAIYSTKWSAAKSNGVPIVATMIIPFQFKTDDKKKTE